MKKIVFTYLLLFASSLSFAQITNPAPYCGSTYTSASSYPEISKVELLGIGNFTINTSNHTPAPGYTYYNNLTPVSLAQGATYTVKVTLKNVDAETMLKGWIDYNQNNIFQSSELIISVPQGSVGNGMSVVKQASFAVQTNSNCLNCVTRMRISFGWHYANWGSMTFRLDSCNTAVTGDGSAGETEDYDVGMVVIAGLNEVANSPVLNISPNPANDIIKFSLKEGVLSDEVEINIYDVTGKKIALKNKYDVLKSEMNIEELNPGLYFIRVSGKNQTTFYYKLIKE